jgi:hypothetical protein
LQALLLSHQTVAQTFILQAAWLLSNYRASTIVRSVRKESTGSP